VKDGTQIVVISGDQPGIVDSIRHGIGRVLRADRNELIVALAGVSAAGFVDGITPDKMGGRWGPPKLGAVWLQADVATNSANTGRTPQYA
jgi:hypothetical protein